MTSTPLHTGQFVIKARRIKRVRLWRAGVGIAVVLGAYALFEAGRWSAGYSVAQAVQVMLQLEAAKTDIERMQRALDSAHITIKMDKQATGALQGNITDMQASLEKQNEELAFYRGIVDPKLNAATQPTVQRIDIVPGDDAQHFQLHLVLIQSVQASSLVQGTLGLTVVGQQQGQPLRLSLKQLVPEQDGDVLKFSYRYFQNLEQSIALPDGFEPQSIEVELRANAHSPQQQQFDWHASAVASSNSQVVS
jgi:hypothetical protein